MPPVVLRGRNLLMLAMLCATLTVASGDPPPAPPLLSAAETQALAAIGTWDGVTASAPLSGPYEDPLQQEIPFGRRSYYLTPWRAYMDTWPGQRYLDCLGFTYNAAPEDAVAVATVMSAAGLHAARVEIGWGNLKYDDPTQLEAPAAARLGTILRALHQAGIRPLILLNANAGWPCPIKTAKVKLLAEAAAGARSITIDQPALVRPGYTGLRGFGYPIAYPLITAVDATSGECTLSAPLNKAVPAGPLELATLKYQPFGGTVRADGTPNPAAAETLAGWNIFVATVCRFVATTLGSAAQPSDAFDVEVWNEYTFGSQFLDDRSYYNPPITYREQLSYSAHGLTRTGHEIILPVTVDYCADPANGLTGVRVISGLANQRPWESGSDLWPGQAGFSRHYYTGLRPGGDFSGLDGIVSPTRAANERSGPLNALGLPDGTPDGKDWHTVLPGSFFVPTLVVGLPEAWHTGYKTEFMTRDVQPVPGPWAQHGRYTHPGTGRPAEVWMTEFNCWRQPWAQALLAATGVPRSDPQYHALMDHVAAKATLRAFVFHSHKGIATITMFAAKDVDDGFAMLPEAFFAKLKEQQHQLSTDSRALVGGQVTALGRVAQLMASGQPLTTARPLAVAALVEQHPRLVFAGDGTPAHPDRFHRDDFACLPFQLDAARFAIGYYVVTRNLVHDWDPSLPPLAPARYDLPDQDFDLTLSNVRGQGARVESWDPLTDARTPVTVLAATGSTLTVRLPTTDYPRFLLLTEAQPGPLVLAPTFALKEDTATLTFSTNLPVSPQVTWGPLPGRISAGQQTLPSGTAFTATAPHWQANSGWQVNVTVDGLTARWPRWGTDVAGVPVWRAPARAAGGAPIPTLHIPTLPSTPPPAAYTVVLPAGLAWASEVPVRQLQLGPAATPVAVQLMLAPPPPDGLLSLLPPLAVGDRCDLRREDWGGTPAWRVDLTLDATAHPGLAATRQRWRVAPTVQGWLVLSAAGAPAGFSQAQAQMEQIAAGITFGAAP